MQIRLLLLYLLWGTGPIAQVKILPPIIKKLASIKRPVTCFSLNHEPLLVVPDLPDNFKKAGQSIIKTQNKVFVIIDGTGRIYRLNQAKESFSWTKIDSTYFSGYNFGAINFSLDTTFYSFGGNGFWHINGFLRYFNPTSKEWNILPTTDPFYFSRKMAEGYNNFYYLDTVGKFLYMQGIDFSQERIKEPFSYAPFKNMLLRLNITNGVYDTIGKLTENRYSFLASTPWGVLVNDGKIIDVKNNLVYQLSKTKKDEILALKENSTSSNNFSISFFVDSTLFIGNYIDKIDSMKINQSDLIKEEASFYTPINLVTKQTETNGKNIIIVVLIMLVIYLLVLLFGKGEKKPLIASLGLEINNENQQDIKNEPGSQVSFRSSKIIDLLEQRELDLLSFIFKQSAEERLTSIEEINKVIGASHRNLEIQKRLRSDLIISINEKLSIITKSKKLVIEKQRSEFDKRSFEYFIQPEFMELVGRIVG